MNAESGKQRVGIVRSGLRERGLDGLVLTKPENVSYLTGFAGEDSWAIVTKTGVYLVTDSRYIEQARKECVGTTLLQRAGKDPIAQAGGLFLRKLKSIKTLGVETSIPVGMFEVLRKNAGISLKPVAGIVEEPRTIKDLDETAAIMAAAAISARAFGEILQQIEPGITENELAGALDFQMRKLGAKNAFETIVAFGANGSRPHHHPSQRKLKPRDTILIDFGARYEGYCSDITRSFAFGTPTPAYRATYAVVEKAQAAAIAVARAGVDLVEVDAAARAVIRESGLPVYGHGTGHGIGLEIHENPFLKENAQGKLRVGQILTIEPGVYLPDKLGIRIEDEILITETGCEVITSECPRTPILQR
ncbi:MAG: aminopeptidase P family protein [Phycisphaerales bacterium]